MYVKNSIKGIQDSCIRNNNKEKSDSTEDCRMSFVRVAFYPILTVAVPIKEYNT